MATELATEQSADRRAHLSGGEPFRQAARCARPASPEKGLERVIRGILIRLLAGEVPTLALLEQVDVLWTALVEAEKSYALFRGAPTSC